MSDFDLNDLNPGIRRTVAWLREHGFDTCDSGDGETHEFDCDQPYAYVYAQVDLPSMISECDRLWTLVSHVEGAHVECNYSPCDGYAILVLVGVDDEKLTQERRRTFRVLDGGDT